MSEPTIWWLLTGAIVAIELLTGTFYLLMLALGAAAAALAAHAGVNLTTQVTLAAVVGGSAVALSQWKRPPTHGAPPAAANRNVHLDIGEIIQINAWSPDGTASVQYRGALWTAIHRPGIMPTTGAHRVAEMVGNRLLVDKT